MIEKIISNGQSGAARAALDWALNHGLLHGGWCPKGRKMNDGVLDQKYLLEETPNSNYKVSKKWNVRDSDGTLVFTLEPELHGHALKAFKYAEEQEKPCIHIAGASEQTGADLRAFIEERNIRTLNVAGSPDSEELAIYLTVEDTLNEAFPELA
jgi:hypothetical protein